MSLNEVQVITSIGEQRITAAIGTTAAVKITEVALGDGNGARYTPLASATTLKREKVRAAITRQSMIDRNTWRVTVEFGTDIDPFTLREIGFFNDAGELIFLVAGPQMVEGQVGVFDLIFEHVLNLSAIRDGLVMVDATSDALFDLTVNAAHAITNLQLQQLLQADAIRALQS